MRSRNYEPEIKTRNIPKRDGRGHIALSLLLNRTDASVQIRGEGFISLADAKYMLSVLEDFIGIGDDHEHAAADAAAAWAETAQRWAD